MDNPIDNTTMFVGVCVIGVIGWGVIELIILLVKHISIVWK